MNLAKSSGVKTWEREDANLGPDLYRSYLKKKSKFLTTVYFSSFVTSKERAETLSALMKAPPESGLFWQRLASLCLYVYKEKSQKAKLASLWGDRVLVPFLPERQRPLGRRRRCSDVGWHYPHIRLSIRPWERPQGRGRSLSPQGL